MSERGERGATGAKGERERDATEVKGAAVEGGPIKNYSLPL